jgi:hypothetical protein
MIPSLSYLFCGQWSIAAAIATIEGHCCCYGDSKGRTAYMRATAASAALLLAN